MSVKLVMRASRASSKSVGLENFETVYFPYIIYDGKTALLHS